MLTNLNMSNIFLLSLLPVPGRNSNSARGVHPPRLASCSVLWGCFHLLLFRWKSWLGFSILFSTSPASYVCYGHELPIMLRIIWSSSNHFTVSIPQETGTKDKMTAKPKVHILANTSTHPRHTDKRDSTWSTVCFSSDLLPSLKHYHRHRYQMIP